MSNIEQNLQKILSSRYGKDVRQAIHDGIHDCYEDGKSGAIDLVAREQIANLVANNNPTEGNSELLDIRVGADGTTYDSAGEAVREQVFAMNKLSSFITPIFNITPGAQKSWHYSFNPDTSTYTVSIVDNEKMDNVVFGRCKKADKTSATFLVTSYNEVVGAVNKIVFNQDISYVYNGGFVALSGDLEESSMKIEPLSNAYFNNHYIFAIMVGDRIFTGPNQALFDEFDDHNDFIRREIKWNIHYFEHRDSILYEYIKEIVIIRNDNKYSIAISSFEYNENKKQIIFIIDAENSGTSKAFFAYLENPLQKYKDGIIHFINDDYGIEMYILLDVVSLSLNTVTYYNEYKNDNEVTIYNRLKREVASKINAPVLSNALDTMFYFKHYAYKLKVIKEVYVEKNDNKYSIAISSFEYNENKKRIIFIIDAENSGPNKFITISLENIDINSDGVFHVVDSKYNIEMYILLDVEKIINGFSYGNDITENNITVYNRLKQEISILNNAPTLLNYINNARIKSEVENVKQKLKGITIVNFGDSIFGNKRPPMDISTAIANLTGATVHNLGFGGCRMAKHHDSSWDAFSMYQLANSIANNNYDLQESVDISQNDMPTYFRETIELLKSIDFNSVNIITIAYGTNDFTAGVLLDNELNSKDTDSFGGALRYSIETLLNAFPNLKIFICSQTYRFWLNNEIFEEDSDTKLINNNKLTDFVTKTEEISKEYHLKFIDNYYSLGINKYNRSYWFPQNDGTHHNQIGGQLIAENMVNEMF